MDSAAQVAKVVKMMQNVFGFDDCLNVFAVLRISWPLRTT